MSLQANRTFRWVVGFVRLLLGIFFRNIEVVGNKNVPTTGGGIFIAWHPNGLIDPALILTQSPRPPIFGARHGLFKIPVLGRIVRSLGTVPIYRRSDLSTNADEATRREANRKSLDALAQAVARGSFVVLFPEGTSHDNPHPVEIRTGAARLYLQALQHLPDGAPKPLVVPVGLHYDRKQVFGSKALVAFHPPLEFAHWPSNISQEDRVSGLTLTFDRTLREIVHATDSWETNQILHRARKLLRADRASRAGTRLRAPPMREWVLGFARLWTGYSTRSATHPEATAALIGRIRAYDNDLAALGLEDHELDSNLRLVSPWLPVIALTQAILVFVVLPPILFIGYLANLPTALLVKGLTQTVRKEFKDEASVKVLVGAILFPVTWLTIAVFVAWGNSYLGLLYPQIETRPFLSGAIAFVLSAVGGFVALFYGRLAAEARRSLQVRLTRVRRRTAITGLLARRRTIAAELEELVQDLDLPGIVTDDGRVTMGPWPSPRPSP